MYKYLYIIHKYFQDADKNYIICYVKIISLYNIYPHYFLDVCTFRLPLKLSIFHLDIIILY